MTCRNYIPGPNDCMHGVRKSDHCWQCTRMANELLGDAEMRAGHAGGEKRMTDDPRKLREQIGYLIGMLQVRGDPRSLPEILDEVERGTEDK